MALFDREKEFEELDFVLRSKGESVFGGVWATAFRQNGVVGGVGEGEWAASYLAAYLARLQELHFSPR